MMCVRPEAKYRCGNTQIVSLVGGGGAHLGGGAPVVFPFKDRVDGDDSGQSESIGKNGRRITRF